MREYSSNRHKKIGDLSEEKIIKYNGRYILVVQNHKGSMLDMKSIGERVNVLGYVTPFGCRREGNLDIFEVEPISSEEEAQVAEALWKQGLHGPVFNSYGRGPYVPAEDGSARLSSNNQDLSDKGIANLVSKIFGEEAKKDVLGLLNPDGMIDFRALGNYFMSKAKQSDQ